MLLGYLQPRKMDAPYVPINKNAKYTLVELVIPKNLRMIGKVLPNLWKFSFVDHDLKKCLEFKRDQYMEKVQNVESGAIELFPMEWAQ